MKYVSKFINIFKEREKPLKYIVGKILVSTKLCLLFSIKRKHYKLKFYPSSLSLFTWLYPNDRIDEDIFFDKYLKKSDNVVDVGANIGTISLLASDMVSETGKVFSVEANPKTFEYLEGNIAFNNRKNITVYNVALGDKKGEIEFSDMFEDDQNKIISNGTGIKVPITLLDELKINEANIDLLKIDVEGFEIFVLKGAAELLKHTSCIYFESWESHFNNYNYSTVDVLGLLKSQGFSCYRFTDLYSLAEVKHDYVSKDCENIIAVKDINSFIQRTNFKLGNR
jgi:FkbM family methyltransferase